MLNKFNKYKKYNILQIPEPNKQLANFLRKE